ncbi:MAG: alkaline phosphatase family protein [Candidatus Tumulicola sp.]
MSSRAPAAAFIAAGLLLNGCTAGGTGTAFTPPNGDSAPTRNRSSNHLQHIVLVIQENRSFDNLFATFPGADGATSGKNSKGQTVTLVKANLAGALDVNHASKAFLAAYDNGKMDGFNLEGIDGNNPAGNYPYQYVNPSKIKTYWTLAQQYALADHMFQTQGSGSFTAHQDLIAGTTAGTFGTLTGSLIDYPSNFKNWGCDAPAGTTTPITQWNGSYPIPINTSGPFPCLTYPTGTLRDLLDEKKVSWKYYAPPYVNATAGTLWNAFAAIDAVRHGPEWATNISTPEKNVITDVRNGKLPAVSWVIPDQPHSDHPNGKGAPDEGPSWVASVVNAIGKSSYWNSTAVIVVWDDWGGFYDHEPPPFLDHAGGLGFRVPMIVVSPYVAAGTISHTKYEFGSILKFIEDTFDLGSLGTTDKRATSIGNMFDFAQKPRAFQAIPADRSLEQIMHEPVSTAPIDSE